MVPTVWPGYLADSASPRALIVGPPSLSSPPVHRPTRFRLAGPATYSPPPRRGRKIVLFLALGLLSIFATMLWEFWATS
jgi:hypothetical protein